MGKKKEERKKLILVGGQQGQFVPAMHVRVGAMGWLVCPQRVVWWWDQGGTGCSSDRWLCQGGGDVVGVVAATRLGTTGLVSCVHDGAMQWQIPLRATSDVVVGEQGWPSCARWEEMVVML